MTNLEEYRAQLMDCLWVENPMNAFIAHMIDIVDQCTACDYIIEDLKAPTGVDKRYRITTPGFKFPEHGRRAIEQSDLLPIGSVVDFIFED